jgi:hypothetical protein
VMLRYSRGDLLLARPSTGALAGDHHSLQEQLPTPDTPGLPSLQGAGEALGPDRAVQAQLLCDLHVLRGLGEEQLGVLPTTGQLVFIDLERGDRLRVEDADTHLSHLLKESFRRMEIRQRPRIPGVGFRGLECLR